MKLHYWNKGNKCHRCGVERRKGSVRVRVENKAPGRTRYFRVMSGWQYMVNGEWTFERPSCAKLRAELLKKING